MEKMQLIFFVPPNEELEIAPPKIWMYPHKWKDGKTCGHAELIVFVLDVSLINELVTNNLII